MTWRDYTDGPEHGGFGAPPSHTTTLVTACIVLCILILMVAWCRQEITEMWRWLNG